MANLEFQALAAGLGAVPRWVQRHEQGRKDRALSEGRYAARRSGLRALRAQASRAPCAQANEPRLRPRQMKHNMHHALTNEVGYDEDVALEPALDDGGESRVRCSRVRSTDARGDANADVLASFARAPFLRFRASTARDVECGAIDANRARPF